MDQLVDEIETKVPDVLENNQEVELEKDDYPNIIYVFKQLCVAWILVYTFL